MPNELTEQERRWGHIDLPTLVVARLCRAVQELSEAGLSELDLELAFERVAMSIEQLGKQVMVLGHEEHHDRTPTERHLRQIGHDLERLIDSLVELAEQAKYGDRPATRRDLDFLRSDPLFRLVLNRLSFLASARGRYRLIDTMTGTIDSYTEPGYAWFDPIDRWIRDHDPDIPGLLGSPDFVQHYPSIRNRYLVEAVQRAARAICRMFTLGLCGAQGQQLSGLIAPFLYLRDAELCDPSGRCR